MQNFKVTVHPSAHHLAREDQLAWKLAALATDPVAVEPDVTEMIINRIIDNAGVAMAAINRGPVAMARAQALLHPRNGGATVFGLPPAAKVHAEWAAWANGTAVRELDFHDTFLAADYSHPGDNIPALLAVAQQLNCSGADLIRGLATAYEVQIDLVKGICLGFDPPIPQGRNFQLESLCALPRGQAGRRSGRPGDAGRRRAVPHL